MDVDGAEARLPVGIGDGVTVGGVDVAHVPRRDEGTDG